MEATAWQQSICMKYEETMVVKVAQTRQGCTATQGNIAASAPDSCPTNCTALLPQIYESSNTSPNLPPLDSLERVAFLVFRNTVSFRHSNLEHAQSAQQTHKFPWAASGAFGVIPLAIAACGFQIGTTLEEHCTKQGYQQAEG